MFLKTDKRLHLVSVVPQHRQISGIVVMQSTDRKMRRKMRIMTMIMMMITVKMEMNMWYKMVLAYAAHDGLLHLLPLVPYPLGDADGDGDGHTRHQEEEGGVNIGKSRAVKGRRCRAPWHIRQHPFLYLVQNTAFVYTQDAAREFVM